MSLFAVTKIAQARTEADKAHKNSGEKVSYCICRLVSEDYRTGSKWRGYEILPVYDYGPRGFGDFRGPILYKTPGRETFH